MNKRENKKNNSLEEYDNILRNFYDNIYGEDIKEVPLTAGQYIIASRTELGLIYQKLSLFEETFEGLKREIIEEAKKEAENIIQEAKLKTFTIIDNNINMENDELEIIRTVKDLAGENLIYLYKQIRTEVQNNINTLIKIERGIQSNLNELEIYRDINKIKKIY